MGPAVSKDSLAALSRWFETSARRKQAEQDRQEFEQALREMRNEFRFMEVGASA